MPRKKKTETDAPASVPSPAPEASGTEKKRARRASKADVLGAFLTDGTRGLDALQSESGVTVSAIDYAADMLQKMGGDATDLHKWAADNALAGRGRPTVKTGDVRTYNAAGKEGGTPSIRLPVNVLGLGVGGTVRVRFEADAIVVERA